MSCPALTGTNDNECVTWLICLTNFQWIIWGTAGCYHFCNEDTCGLKRNFRLSDATITQQLTIASVLSIRVHVRRLHKLFDSLLLIPSMHIQYPCIKLLLVLGQTSSPFGEPFPCRIFDSDSFALVLECKNGSSDTHRHTSTPFLCCCRHKVHICPACEAPALQSPAKASFPPKVH